MASLRSILLTLCVLAAFTTHAVGPCEPQLLRLELLDDRLMLEGNDVELVSSRPGHSRGRNHRLMYRARVAGERVLLKLVEGSAPRELIASAPGHYIGGPKMVGLATLQLEGRDRLEFIVMEELFPDQPSFTFQGLYEASAERRAEGARAMITGPPATRLTRRLAEHLARGWIHDVLPPFDLDFIMTNEDVRLIDVGSLTVGRRAKVRDWDRFFTHVQLRLVARALELTLGPAVGDRYREDLMSAMRALVTDDERFARMRRSAEEVYDANGAFLELMNQTTRSP